MSASAVAIGWWLISGLGAVLLITSQIYGWLYLRRQTRMTEQAPVGLDALIAEAETRLGVTVLPFQREWLKAALAGEPVVAYTGRRAGWTTAQRVAADIREHS